MDNPKVSNPNDFKVVDFKNTMGFDFTPEMGCMYDGRPISGISGKAGIVAGEKITLPYHVGKRLSVNLAKQCMVREDDGKPMTDSQGQPIIRAIWSEEHVDEVAKSFIAELYAEAKPIAQSETDRLMEKVEEYKKMVEKVINKDDAPKDAVEKSEVTNAVYQDKADVIDELEKRGIQHDKRKSKAELEKLLT